MSFPIKLQILRAKIRGFEAAGRTIASQIRKSEKEHKNRLWNEKRRLGYFCRHHLVAYGLLRGIHYEEIERCATNNQLDAKLLFTILQEHNVPEKVGPRLVFREWTLEKVKQSVASSVEASATSSTNQAAPATSASSGEPVQSKTSASSRPLIPVRTSATAVLPVQSNRPNLLEKARSLLGKKA